MSLASAETAPAETAPALRVILGEGDVLLREGIDYRAGATVDREHDAADLGLRRIECPLLALSSAGGALPRFYGDVLEVWRPWAREISGRGVDGSHFLVEDQPEQFATALSALGSKSQQSLESTP